MNLDALITQFDRALKTLSSPAQTTADYPARQSAEAELSKAEQRHSAGLMRVNHVGEVCAQALYQAQGLFARQLEIAQFHHAACAEETAHLNWTAQRLHELGSRPSLLNPLWYGGAFALGAVAGALGDKTSLSFVVETEKQVESHLRGHLSQLPEHDTRSRAIVTQMAQDEAAHGLAAQTLGAQPLPSVVSQLMRGAAKVMTRTAYYV